MLLEGGKMTVEPTVLEKFKKNNEDFDVMGVVRTLYPDIEIKMPAPKEKNKQNEMV